MQVISCLIVCLTFIGVLVLASFCWKQWIHNGLDKWLASEAKRLADNNAELRRRQRRHQNKIRQLQKIIDDRDVEIEELEGQVDYLEDLNDDLIQQLGGENGEVE